LKNRKINNIKIKNSHLRHAGSRCKRRGPLRQPNGPNNAANPLNPTFPTHFARGLHGSNPHSPHHPHSPPSRRPRSFPSAALHSRAAMRNPSSSALSAPMLVLVAPPSCCLNCLRCLHRERMFHCPQRCLRRCPWLAVCWRQVLARLAHPVPIFCYCCME